MAGFAMEKRRIGIALISYWTGFLPPPRPHDSRWQTCSGMVMLLIFLDTARTTALSILVSAGPPTVASNPGPEKPGGRRPSPPSCIASSSSFSSAARPSSSFFSSAARPSCSLTSAASDCLTHSVPGRQQAEIEVPLMIWHSDPGQHGSAVQMLPIEVQFAGKGTHLGKPGPVPCRHLNPSQQGVGNMPPQKPNSWLQVGLGGKQILPPDGTPS
mmetsp:Transcript_11580/g.22035  ORF Transcript_11580/g.22035 Transcript_11580/m.22035 type:complete len:214 (-) Transcript_11580:909-1550(-)